MLVRFETKAYPSITMFGDVAGELLRLMGMSGDVPGAIEGCNVGKALARLRTGLAHLDLGSGEAGVSDTGDDDESEVSLPVRAFTLLELLSIAARNESHVIWTKKEPMNRNHVSEPTSDRPTDPSKVLARDDLTFEEKVALLKDWQLDLTNRMTATDESMEGTKDEGQLAEQQRHVSHALSILEQEDRAH